MRGSFFRKHRNPTGVTAWMTALVIEGITTPLTRQIFRDGLFVAIPSPIHVIFSLSCQAVLLEAIRWSCLEEFIPVSSMEGA